MNPVPVSAPPHPFASIRTMPLRVLAINVGREPPVLEAVTVFVLVAVARADAVEEARGAAPPQPASASMVTPTATTIGPALRAELDRPVTEPMLWECLGLFKTETNKPRR
jgi:hypothetical protein